MSEARSQQILRLSNYMASGVPYISGVYSPLINTITNNANIILKKSTDNWYTIRSTGGDHTMDSLVVGDASDGTFTEVTIAPTISVVGALGASYYYHFQIRWWDSSNIAVFTLDVDSPYDLKLYTINISTGVSTSVGTLISGVLRGKNGICVCVNNTYVYVYTTRVDTGINSYIKRYLKTDIATTVEYDMPLLYFYSGTYYRYMLYPIIAVTTNYLWAVNMNASTDEASLYMFPLTNIQIGTCIGNGLQNSFLDNGMFHFQTDYDMTTMYFMPRNYSPLNYSSGVSGIVYITESDLIKYGAL